MKVGDYVRLISVKELQGQPLALVGEIGVVLSAYDCAPPCYDVRFTRCVVVCLATMLEPAKRARLLVEKGAAVLWLSTNVCDPGAKVLEESIVSLAFIRQLTLALGCHARVADGAVELWREADV